MDGATAADHSGTPGSVTFSSSDTEKTFSFSATDDQTDDDGEKVRLTFGTLSSGVSSAAPSQTVDSITDDDETGVTLSRTTLDIDEGDQGAYTVVLASQPTATVTITVSGHSGTELTVWTRPPSPSRRRTGRRSRP